MKCLCLCGMLIWHLCFKQEDQLIEWMTKAQAMALRINILLYNDSYLESSHLSCGKKVDPTPSAREVLWQVDEIKLYFKIFKVLYMLKYLDFYLVNISTMLLIVLEMHFSLLFSNKAYFRLCYVVHKIQSPFFHVNPYY